MPHPRGQLGRLTRRQGASPAHPANPLRRGVDRARRRTLLVAVALPAAALPALLCVALPLPWDLPYRLAGALGGWVLAALGTALGLRLRLRALERRAADSWERSWRRVEPLWSGRALPWRDLSDD
ncbi:hypothetical protein AB0K51_29055 [Kitasatospora sp. NPDC049285]|uniref:hypothetical protein n=1 Tax=Kitasatospora sp. NPDC049285 TaxID=3157096 RepID=UPI003437D948